MNKYYKTLELHKILQMLANETVFEKTRDAALNIQPLTDLDEVKYENEKTKAALDMSIKNGSPPFIRANDVTPALLRAKAGASLSLKELLDTGRVLNQIKMLADWFKGCANTGGSPLNYLFEGLKPDSVLQREIESAIASEEEVADSASSELAAIRRKKFQAGMKIRETLEKMTRGSAFQRYLQENIVTIRDGRYVLPVKAEFRGEVKGLIHDTSSSGQTYFIEPMSVVEANNDLRLLENKEQEEINRIIAKLSAKCGESASDIAGGFNICTELNLYFSKSSLALKMSAVMPEITGDGVIYLKKARHPLIDKNTVVPIDISLGGGFQALIVTGPNTGGKTVTLKTTGLLVLMTMCGLLIPATEGSKISIFDNILADIGDQQSIEQSLSTFSAHMNKVIEILKLSNDKSLVLIDELGSGTDPVEGAALAIAIIESLKEKNAKLMVTTHYQELKMYAIESNGVENASCEFDIKTLRPTYKLIIGSPGKSKAFAISHRLGMPGDIIKKAEDLVSNENIRFERVVEALENARLELENQNREITRLKAEQEEKTERLRKELQEFNEKKEAELEKARNTAMRIIEDTKYKSNELISELDKLRKEKEKESFSQNVIDSKIKNKRVFNELYNIANPVDKPEYGSYSLSRPLKKGDEVLITDINKKGTVISIGNDGTVTAQVGIMKTKVDINKIRLSDENPVKNNSGSISAKNVRGKIERSASMELDIRGCTSDEGIYEIEAFIDNAVMAGTGLLTIIHGKGTGVLRKAVQKRLREIPSVKSFRTGVYGEGEDGVTIVELK